MMPLPRSQAHHQRPADPWPATETLLTQYEDLVAELQRQILILRAERDETRRLLHPPPAPGAPPIRCRECPARFVPGNPRTKLCERCRKAHKAKWTATTDARRSLKRAQLSAAAHV